MKEWQFSCYLKCTVKEVTLSQWWIPECLPWKLLHTPLLNCPFPHFLSDKVWNLVKNMVKKTILFSCGVKMPFLFCVPLLLLLFPNTISPEQKQVTSSASHIRKHFTLIMILYIMILQYHEVSWNISFWCFPIRSTLHRAKSCRPTMETEVRRVVRPTSLFPPPP